MFLKILKFFFQPFTTVDQAYAIGQKHGLTAEDYFNEKALFALQDYGVHLTEELIVDLRDYAFKKWVEQNPVQM